jgi:hypothetical protein
MPRFDERAELAPRDVVARAIDHEIKRLGLDYVHLDISHKPPEFVKDHFPTIHAKLLELGIDMTKAADPGGARAALYLRRRHHRSRRPHRPAGALCGGRMHRKRAARRQPAGVQLAARMLRVRRGGGDDILATGTMLRCAAADPRLGRKPRHRFRRGSRRQAELDRTPPLHVELCRHRPHHQAARARASTASSC